MVARKILILSAAICILMPGTHVRAYDLFDRAYEMMSQGKLVKALELYEKALAANPESPDIWQEYTICLRKLKRFQKSLQAGWKTMELGGETEGRWANIGNVMLEVHAWEQAFDAYRKADAMTRNKKWAAQNFLNLGFEQWIYGNNSGAEKCFTQALSIDPENGLAVLDLGNFHASTGDIVSGKEQIRKAIELLKNDPKSKAMAYAKQSLDAIEKNGSLTAPFPRGKSYQFAPEHLLKRPPAKAALNMMTDRMVKRLVSIEEKATLTLTTPEEWLELLKVNEQRGILTIEYLSPPGKERFHFLISPLTGLKDSKTARDVKAMAEGSGKRLLGRSIEKELEIFELKGREIEGYAYTLSDKSFKKGANPEEYPFVTQGFLLSSGTVHSFTVLTDSKEKAFIMSVLDVLKSISYVR
ncbi:MAG: tetratricopeptide repeat protein [Spirochaetes bacterium]|jgi:tetratricopeptide (TPR) repeat protein|nr:tetratricopeptide repeat protein [Spirochaetota bacterium]